MSYSFIVFFFLSIIYCIAILLLTYFFIYKKISFHLHHVVAFGTGFLIILVFFDFLPHSFSTEVSVRNIIMIMAMGFLVNAFSEVGILPYMKFLNKLLPGKKHNCHQHDSSHIHYHLIPSSVGCSAVGCLILCAFFDGVRLASALLIDMKTAMMMSIGLLFHLLPESVTVLGIGLSSGFSRRSLFGIILAFCFAFLGGYHVFFLLSYMENLESFVLPFASGLFLYVCFVHLIPIVIKFKVKKWFLLGAILCFIFLYSSVFLSHHG
ncbi:MAG: ZIP family metal transporter [Bdellovibrionales bacterium]|nr:ZIP family metal transporter [Bdellovibrionales bacterium]